MKKYLFFLTILTFAALHNNAHEKDLLTSLQKARTTQQASSGKNRSLQPQEFPATYQLVYELIDYIEHNSIQVTIAPKATTIYAEFQQLYIPESIAYSIENFAKKINNAANEKEISQEEQLAFLEQKTALLHALGYSKTPKKTLQSWLYTLANTASICLGAYVLKNKDINTKQKALGVTLIGSGFINIFQTITNHWQQQKQKDNIADQTVIQFGDVNTVALALQSLQPQVQRSYELLENYTYSSFATKPWHAFKNWYNNTTHTKNREQALQKALQQKMQLMQDIEYLLQQQSNEQAKHNQDENQQ